MEPAPGALSTVTSPPIIRQKWRVRARPRPVPPNRRVVDASAWVNASNRRPSCSGVIPIPVSATRNTSQSPAPPSPLALALARLAGRGEGDLRPAR